MVSNHGRPWRPITQESYFKWLSAYTNPEETRGKNKAIMFIANKKSPANFPSPIFSSMSVPSKSENFMRTIAVHLCSATILYENI